MGFGKKQPEQEAEGDKDGWRPTSRSELKEIERRARAREEAARAEKAKPRKPERLEHPTHVDEMNDLWRRMAQNKPLKKINAKAVAAKFREIIVLRQKAFDTDRSAKKDPRWRPAFLQYELFESRANADGNFILDVQGKLARMSWKELAWLIEAATGEAVRTKDFSEAFHFAYNIVLQALGVDLNEDETRYRLTDRDQVLKTWPIDVIKRKDMKRKNGELKAKNDEDEDEEEEETTGKDKKAADDEDEDETPPKKKGKKFGKKKSSDDEEDEEDEPVAKKKAKRAAVNGEDKPTRKKVGTVKLADASIIRTTSKKREGGGPKGKLYGLVTKKGVKLKSLLAEAEEAELPLAKVKKWVTMMSQNGFLEVE